MRKDFDAQIGIWGSVERAPGTDGEIYDLTIRCVDFSEPEPKVIYEKTNVRTNSVSEIPHLYVKEMLDKLYDRQPGGPPSVDPGAEERWKTGPNLVVGDFEKGARGVPKGWEPVAGQKREPLGNLVKWTTEAGNSQNHVIRFTFPASVGDDTGVLYYSDWFPVQEAATYRFQCRWRSNGPAVKVFIKCYDEMSSEYRQEKITAASADRPDPVTGSLNSSGSAPRGLSQPAEPQGPEEHLEHANAGLHSQAHQLLAQVGQGDALRLPGRRGRGVRRRRAQADCSSPLAEPQQGPSPLGRIQGDHPGNAGRRAPRKEAREKMKKEEKEGMEDEG